MLAAKSARRWRGWRRDRTTCGGTRVERLGKGVHRAVVHKHAGDAVDNRLARAAGAEGDDRRAARLRLDRDHPEIFDARAGGPRPRGRYRSRISSSRAPAEELDVRPAERSSRACSGPRPTIRQAARRPAGTHRWPRPPACTARARTPRGSRDPAARVWVWGGKSLYLQEDTQRSTRDYSIGGSALQHSGSSRRSGRPGPPWPRSHRASRARIGRSSRFCSAPTCSAPK